MPQLRLMLLAVCSLVGSRNSFTIEKGFGPHLDRQDAARYVPLNRFSVRNT